MEMAQFGDTEMESTEIKSVSRRLCGSPSPLSPKGGSSSVSSNSSSEGTGELAQEFAKLANIVDDRKALSVGKLKRAICPGPKFCVCSLDFGLMGGAIGNHNPEAFSPELSLNGI